MNNDEEVYCCAHGLRTPVERCAVTCTCSCRCDSHIIGYKCLGDTDEGCPDDCTEFTAADSA